MYCHFFMNHNVELRTQIGYRFVITIHYQGKYTYVEIYIPCYCGLKDGRHLNNVYILQSWFVCDLTQKIFLKQLLTAKSSDRT